MKPRTTLVIATGKRVCRADHPGQFVRKVAAKKSKQRKGGEIGTNLSRTSGWTDEMKR